jgi:hypothetical protein
MPFSYSVFVREWQWRGSKYLCSLDVGIRWECNSLASRCASFDREEGSLVLLGWESVSACI